MVRKTLIFEGKVQGVGFRPLAFRTAQALALRGQIYNQGSSAVVDLEGSKDSILAFKNNLMDSLPDAARVDHIKESWLDDCGFYNLEIVESRKQEANGIGVPPDLKTCDQCMQEFLDPNDRRFLYPFIACTSCGPRFSILKSLPYDRPHSAMAVFKPCHICAREYAAPQSRWFHAQNISCGQCGPNLSLCDGQARALKDDSIWDKISRIHQCLNSDGIIALKGLGGYQLVCNARSTAALKRLRSIKNRPEQALALMASDIDALSDEDSRRIKLMKSLAGPLVLAKGRYALPIDLIAPDSSELAIMLPTSALHYLLFLNRSLAKSFDFLIVTSANRHGQAMICEGADAHCQFRGMVDLFVDHDREIVNRVDDSLVVEEGRSQIWRQARGFAPSVLHHEMIVPGILACGGDRKNTFCLSKPKMLYMSSHIGDLLDASTFKSYQSQIKRLRELLNIHLRFLAVDAHPDFVSKQFAKKLSQKLEIPVLEVQHHLAHAASCMGEHGLDKSLAICFDGSGYGSDAHIWGGEILGVDLQKAQWQRLASLDQHHLLGGEKAIYEPARQLHERMMKANLMSVDDSPWGKLYEAKEFFPQTSSMGRLFDAVAALLLPQYGMISYEAQAAIALEALAKRSSLDRNYRVECDNGLANTDLLLSQVHADVQAKISLTDIANSFHWAVARLSRLMIEHSYQSFQSDSVCLTGGVFCNRLLANLVSMELKKNGLKVFQHHRTPPNDAGLSYGQLLFASSLIRNHPERNWHCMNYQLPKLL